MKRRIAAILLSALLATIHVACFDKPDAPHIGTGDGGTMNDGRLAIDASMTDAATSCGPVHDDFNTTGGAPCGAWGSAVNATVMTRTGTTLSIKPTLPGSGAACTSMLFGFSLGTSIEIVQPIDGSGASSIFSIAAGGHTVGVQIAYGVAGTEIRETCDMQSPVLEPYNAISHRWWRFAPAGTGVDVTSGSDGVTWTKSLLDNCPWGIPITTVSANIGASAGSGTALPALYDNFNTNPCPPPN